MASQPPLLPADHDSLQPHRLKKYHRPSGRDTNPERIYVAKWKKTNRRSPGVNSGFTMLEHILTPDGGHPGPVSRRDAAVAASVIQWLGTNCGMGFLWECERAIDQSRDQDEAARVRSNLLARRRAEDEYQRQEAEKRFHRKTRRLELEE